MVQDVDIQFMGLRVLEILMQYSAYESMLRGEIVLLEQIKAILGDLALSPTENVATSAAFIECKIIGILNDDT